jgi:glycosyltransferase involved in cell wall biosynthesis
MALLTPETAEFAIVAFEGPDAYSRAGGLAVRVRDLSQTLAGAGFSTHLFFVGDPSLPGIEQLGQLTLHRWCQWISAYHPGGVYEGEWGKLQDFNASLPGALTAQVRHAASAGKVTVLMAEDWQTAALSIATSYLLAQEGLLRYVVPVWTTNSLYGLEGVDFATLSHAAGLMTVSRYMKHALRPLGIDPLVAQNGISSEAIVNVPPAQSRSLRKAFGDGIAMFKIGRFTPDKGWMPAVEAAALLKHMGTRVRLLIRGDRGAYGEDVLTHAHIYGLRVEDLRETYTTVEQLCGAIASRPDVDVFNLASFLPDSLLPPIYAAVDGVLANSLHEPFGLVGLEVMGAGGCAFVGSTGEEYAEADINGVVLDTGDPREIVFNLQRLQGAPDHLKQLKRRAKETAKAYRWQVKIEELFAKLEYVALSRNVEVPG